MEYLISVLPMAVGSVDRLEEIPDRLKFLFEFDPAASLAREEVAGVLHEPGARDGDRGAAAELRRGGRSRSRDVPRRCRRA